MNSLSNWNWKWEGSSINCCHNISNPPLQREMEIKGGSIFCSHYILNPSPMGIENRREYFAAIIWSWVQYFAGFKILYDTTGISIFSGFTRLNTITLTKPLQFTVLMQCYLIPLLQKVAIASAGITMTVWCKLLMCDL